jgi:hypothetical protein
MNKIFSISFVPNRYTSCLIHDMTLTDFTDEMSEMRIRAVQFVFVVGVGVPLVIEMGRT